MTQSEIVGYVETLMWAGLWLGVARHLRAKGKGVLVRHLAGFATGGVLTFCLFAVLFQTRVLEPNPPTFDITPEQYTSRLNRLLQEWEHQPRIDPTDVFVAKEFNMIGTDLAPRTSVLVGISRSDEKVFRVIVEGPITSDSQAQQNLLRLVSATVAATSKDATTDDVYQQLSQNVGDEALLFGDARVTLETKPGTSWKFYVLPQ